MKDIEIHYLGSSKFSLSAKAKDYKSANTIMEKAIEEITKNAKKLNINIDIKEK